MALNVKSLPHLHILLLNLFEFFKVYFTMFLIRLVQELLKKINLYRM